MEDPDDPFWANNCGSMHFARSDFINGVDSPRESVNAITSLLDASMVYGSDAPRAEELRSFVDGKLKTSDEEGLLLPYNVNGYPNAGSGSEFFLAGDIRVNEQAGLIAMHTLWLREHNRLAEAISQRYQDASDEDVFQLARKIVGAEIQAITYTEWLPALLGPMAPDMASTEFNETVDPSVLNEFSSVVFRFGHSMVSSDFILADKKNGPLTVIPLRDIFFTPEFVADDPLNVDRILGGMARHRAQQIDTHCVGRWLCPCPVLSHCLVVPHFILLI